MMEELKQEIELLKKRLENHDHCLTCGAVIDKAKDYCSEECESMDTEDA